MQSGQPPLTTRQQFLINSAQIAHGYGEFAVVFDPPLQTTKYTLSFTFSHLATVGGPSRLFTNNGYRDKAKTGFLAVIGIGAGAVTGDNIMVEVIVIPDTISEVQSVMSADIVQPAS